jgi:hypothetical protein
MLPTDLTMRIDLSIAVKLLAGLTMHVIRGFDYAC